ncbi:Ras GTPase-activating protein 1, partial [Geodia barretti]
MATYATPGERPPVGLPPSREAIIDQYGDEMDEALVGPVYLRLDDPAFRSYVQYANQTYEEEEAGDEELGLDLSAPPPESWFHGRISRQTASSRLHDLQGEQGEQGVYLVRESETQPGDYAITYLSRTGNASFWVRFTSSYFAAISTHTRTQLRTRDKVQRFRITRYDTGYYIFGGRPFSSMDDVVDRYRSEVIIDGITLGAPIIQTVRPVGRQAMTVTSPRDRTNSIILTQAHRQGEKTGLLLLRKGKKSPVYGKWKEFYFVIKYGEQKLLYYEREDSHKAKGLLDLRQCRAFAVDPTLYGRY